MFITICGDRLWYYGEETLMHINETVYVRYDPSDPREARIYDMVSFHTCIRVIPSYPFALPPYGS